MAWIIVKAILIASSGLLLFLAVFLLGMMVVSGRTDDNTIDPTDWKMRN